VDGLISYIKMLKDEIMYGIGVPPELMEASETGSGYSGRAIPMEAFVESQQRTADRMLALFIEHVLAPLVAWNFGREARFDAKVKKLLKTKTQQTQGQETAGDPSQQGMEQPGQQPGQPQPAQGAFSVSPLVTDRIREIARHTLARAA
jgi:hypothetical protein